MREAGYVEGRNVTIEQRWADNQHRPATGLAADLVAAQVARDRRAIGTRPRIAAKAATATIPIVFVIGDDPVKSGLVASLSRPGGNVTGVTFFAGSELDAKRLELLRELVPKADRHRRAASTPTMPAFERRNAGRCEAACARTLGQQVVTSSTRASERELDARVRKTRPSRRRALLVGGDPLFTSQPPSSSSRWRPSTPFPRSTTLREYAEAGGLMSYGASITDAYRQAGVYVGRILKGDKPSDLPVDAGDEVRAGHQPQDREDARPQRCRCRCIAAPTK